MYDPPGNTSAAAPVLCAASGEYTASDGLLTFVTRTVTFPDTMRFASVLGSISGPTTDEGSGFPAGQSNNVWLCAAAPNVKRSVTRVPDVARNIMFIATPTTPPIEAATRPPAIIRTP